MSTRPRAAARLDGRTVAAQAVADTLTKGHFVADTLRGLRAAGSLDGREAAFARELALGAIRHVETIEHILSSLATYQRERTPSLLRAILYTGVYQLVYLDRVPAFAAVDRAVELARQLVGKRAPGMVNAVLRRVTAAIETQAAAWTGIDPHLVRTAWDRATRFRTPVLPSEASNDLMLVAAATGERPARLAVLRERHGAALAEQIAWASQAVPALVLQRNPLRATPTTFEDGLRLALHDAVEFTDDAAFVPPTTSIADLDAFQSALAYVQDTTAHAAAAAVAAQPGERVLDLCAAPGGKTLALALAMQDRGLVLACDTSAERLARVDENIARFRLTSVRTHLLGGESPALFERLGPFDAALVDVPCSNSGVFSRRPEARAQLSPRKLAALTALQVELLVRAAEAVQPHGRIVYSTCSIEPEENEHVVARFCERTPAWHVAEAATRLPIWGQRLSDWRDGGYFAILRRE